MQRVQHIQRFWDGNALASLNNRKEAGGCPKGRREEEPGGPGRDLQPTGWQIIGTQIFPKSYDDFENVISPHGFLLPSLYSWRWLPESILLKHLKSYGKNSLVIFLISLYQLGSNRTSLLPTLQNHDIHFLSPLKIKNYCFHISGKSLLKSP